jgi:hypothetical protein
MVANGKKIKKEHVKAEMELNLVDFHGIMISVKSLPMNAIVTVIHSGNGFKSMVYVVGTKHMITTDGYNNLYRINHLL